MTTIPVPRKLDHGHSRSYLAALSALRELEVPEPELDDPNPCTVFASGVHRWITHCGHYRRVTIGSGKHARQVTSKLLIMCVCGESKMGDYLKRRAA